MVFLVAFSDWFGRIENSTKPPKPAEFAVRIRLKFSPSLHRSIVRYFLKHPRNHDSFVCSDIEFAEEAQAPFALHFRVPQAASSCLSCAGHTY